MLIPIISTVIPFISKFTDYPQPPTDVGLNVVERVNLF